MVFDTQDVRDLLALARLLRDCARQPQYAATKDQLLSTAMVLENRALCLAVEIPDQRISSEDIAELPR